MGRKPGPRLRALVRAPPWAGGPLPPAQPSSWAAGSVRGKPGRLLHGHSPWPLPRRPREGAWPASGPHRGGGRSYKRTLVCARRLAVTCQSQVLPFPPGPGPAGGSKAGGRGQRGLRGRAPGTGLGQRHNGNHGGGGRKGRRGQEARVPFPPRSGSGSGGSGSRGRCGDHRALGSARVTACRADLGPAHRPGRARWSSGAPLPQRAQGFAQTSSRGGGPGGTLSPSPPAASSSDRTAPASRGPVSPPAPRGEQRGEQPACPPPPGVGAVSGPGHLPGLRGRRPVGGGCLSHTTSLSNPRGGRCCVTGRGPACPCARRPCCWACWA